MGIVNTFINNISDIHSSSSGAMLQRIMTINC